jgi:hypothetical protein
MKAKTTVSMDKAQKTRSFPVQKIVFVQEFIEDDSGKAVGIKGLSYPDRTCVSVTLTTEGVNAENNSRPSFDEYRKGYSTPRGGEIKIEEGAVLRLNCHDLGDNNFAAEWINIVAKNLDEQKRTVAFGYASVEAFPSDEARELRKAIAARIGEENPELKTSGKLLEKKQLFQRNKMIEDELREQLKNKPRYKNASVMLFHTDAIADVTAEKAGEYFLKYYSDERFARTAGKDGNLYEKMSPGVLIRAVNADGEVIDCVKLGSYDLYKNKAESPEERANLAVRQLNRIPASDAVTYSVLPFDTVKIGEISLKVNSANKLGIDRIQQMLGKTRVNKYSDEGKFLYVEDYAVPAAIRFSQPSGLVSDVYMPHGSKRVQEALLDKGGQEMKEAPPSSPAESEDESDSVSPGM